MALMRPVTSSNTGTPSIEAGSRPAPSACSVITITASAPLASTAVAVPTTPGMDIRFAVWRSCTSATARTAGFARVKPVGFLTAPKSAPADGESGFVRSLLQPAFRTAVTVTSAARVAILRGTETRTGDLQLGGQGTSSPGREMAERTSSMPDVRVESRQFRAPEPRPFLYHQPD